RQNPNVGLAKINAAVEDAVVTLTGPVSDDDQGTPAGATVRRMSGFAGMVNQIELPWSDSELQRQVGEQPQQDPNLVLAKIDASITDALVIGAAPVSNDDEKRQAEAAARQVPGIVSLVNELRSDGDLKQQVEDTLRRVANLARGIAVAVED